MTTIPPRARRLLTAVILVAASSLATLVGISPAQASWGNVTPSSETRAAAVSSVASTGIRAAADLGAFRPGNIISDAVFFDSSTMTEGQIQAFLESKVGTCRSGYTCLKDWYDTTRYIPQDAMCGTYQGGGSERASRIIYKVAQSCGINPQVLLVTLQKEQSLVTDTWPTRDSYRAAMGQGCPDTAACDSTYYGFFNQVQGAAWQFKRYANPPGTSRFFTWYAPGKTWNVKFNPNDSCGTSPVYIENQATANLYYYTPYQPNAAALRAGTGLGDTCSAYGNRNFYNFFTDWFGSTQNPYGPLVTGPARDRVYLVNDGHKFPVATPTDLQAFGAALGGLQVVPSSYLDGLPTAAAATRYIHDPRTGTLYLLELDGTKHRFTGADQITRFGYAFTSYINVEPRLVDAFSAGDEVGSFSRSTDGSGEVYYLDGGALRYVYDTPAYSYAARGKSSYIATIDAAAQARIPRGATFFAPNTLVRAASSGEVYLTTPTSTVVHIPSFALAAEYGATSYKVVSDSVLKKSVAAKDVLAPIVLCGEQAFLATAGSIRPLGGDATGLKTTRLAAADCEALRQGAPLTAPLFVQATDGRDVFAVSGGTLQHVHGYGQLMSLNGGRSLDVIRWRSETMDAVGYAAPLLADGEFVQFVGDGDVYWYADKTLRHVEDYASLIALGAGSLPTIATVPSTYSGAYTYGDPVGNVPLVRAGSFARFSDGPEVYRFVDLQLRHITDYATLVYLGGGRIPAIATIPRSASSAFAVGDPVSARSVQPEGAFVQFQGASEVYLVTGDQLRHVQSVTTLITLGGGRVPPIRSLPADERFAWSVGQPL